MVKIIVLKIALALGFSKVPSDIVEAIQVACQSDMDCVYDAAQYAGRESGFQRYPVATSYDAKDGTSCGEWQIPCVNLPDTTLGRLKVWLALRAYSLKTWGDLRGLAGANDAGVKLTRGRDDERSTIRTLIEGGAL